jgi:hypothetical protein
MLGGRPGFSVDHFFDSILKTRVLSGFFILPAANSLKAGSLPRHILK